MKKQHVLLAVLILLIGGVTVAKLVGMRTLTHGHGSADSELRQALEIGQPAVLLFYSEICEPCRIMSQRITELAVEHGKEARFIKIDYNDDRERDIIRKFSIVQIPTTIILDGQGNVVKRSLEILEKDSIMKAVRGGGEK